MSVSWRQMMWTLLRPEKPVQRVKNGGMDKCREREEKGAIPHKCARCGISTLRAPAPPGCSRSATPIAEVVSS
eukprot:364542-Chlamydomonas_euryale.AAC.17